MTEFGKRRRDDPTSVVYRAASLTSPAFPLVWRAKFCVFLGVLHAGLAVLIWLFVLNIPVERPFSGIYAHERATTGWAPIWVAPALTLVITAYIAWRATEKGVRGSQIWALKFGAATAFGVLVLANVVRNSGYVLQQPGAGVVSVVGALAPMIFMHASQSLLSVLSEVAWFVPIVGALSGAVAFAVAEGMPESDARSDDKEPSRRTSEDGAPAVSQNVRLASAATIGLVSMLASASALGTASIVVAALVGWVWWSKALPNGHVTWPAMLTAGIAAPMLVHALSLQVMIQLEIWFNISGRPVDREGILYPLIFAAPLLVGSVLRRLARW